MDSQLLGHNLRFLLLGVSQQLREASKDIVPLLVEGTGGQSVLMGGGLPAAMTRTANLWPRAAPV